MLLKSETKGIKGLKHCALKKRINFQNFHLFLPSTIVVDKSAK